MTVPVSAQWMDSTDCICMNRAFNMTVYLYWGQLLDSTSTALTHLLSALSYVSWSCNPCFNNPFAHAASCKGRGCDSLNANIYPDSPELTCVSSVSGGVVVHTYNHALPACVRAVQWIWITYSIYVSVTGFLQWPSKLDVLQLLLDHTCKTEKQRTYSQIQKRVANTENITKYRKCKPNPECCKSHRTQWKSVTKQQKFQGTLCSVWLAAFLYLFNLSLYGALALCCIVK